MTDKKRAGKGMGLGNVPKSEVDRLADFLLAFHSGEIGKGGSESAVDVAIRMISENIRPQCPTEQTKLPEANVLAVVIDIEQRVRHTDTMLNDVEDSFTGECQAKRADDLKGPVAIGILQHLDHILCVARTAEGRAKNILNIMGVNRVDHG